MKILKSIFHTIPTIVLILFVLRIFSVMFFPWYIVVSDSMNPTIQKGDHMFLSTYHYYIFNIHQNDVVMFAPSEIFPYRDWVHRVVALPGDRVDITNNIISVNGVPVSYPEIESEDMSLVVPEGMLYQKGDSPSSIHGLVPMKDVLGKVIAHF